MYAGGIYVIRQHSLWGASQVDRQSVTSLTDPIVRVECTFHELCLSEAALPTPLPFMHV